MEELLVLIHIQILENWRWDRPTHAGNLDKWIKELDAQEVGTFDPVDEWEREQKEEGR
jgi:hypothetical protein